MMRIRAVEESIAQRYADQEMRCPTHLSIGQEAAAVGICAALRPNDLAVSGHRAHAHYLAKGGDLRAMVAEIYGKVGGCSRGKGGSMHLIDEAAGFMGSTAIVGGTLPVGVGLALALRHQGQGRVCIVFIGDAVAETGVFLESLSFAALKRLPVLFVCENNLFSVYSGMSVRQPEGRRIHDLAAAIGVPATAGDGNDVRAVRALANDALLAVRAGDGPRFIELSTYRWREHCGPMYDNDLGYRTPEEFKIWKERDPVARLDRELSLEGDVDDAKRSTIAHEIETETEDAFAYAGGSPFPTQEAAFADLYAS